MLASFHCKSKIGAEGIELEVSFSEEELSDNLITEMRFTWNTQDNFVRLRQDLNVYVHFWHDRNLLFQTSYIPEIPTSTWEPNQKYVFTQRVYIPVFIDKFDPDFTGHEDLRLSVGFFSPFDQSGRSKREILEKILTVYPPPPDTPEIVLGDGWYDEERNPEAYLKKWRWIGKQANCIITNPHRDAFLLIRGGVNLAAIQNQKVIFKINEVILDEFIAEEEYFEKTYQVKQEMLGDNDDFSLIITTDKTFIPAQLNPDSRDIRELGLVISFVYFR